MRIARAVIPLLAVVLHTDARDWARTDTSHFVFFSQAGDAQAAHLAKQLERLRDLTAEVLPGAAVPPAGPTIVIVFESTHELGPYQLRHDGRAVDITGLSTRNESDQMIAFPSGILRTPSE